MEMSYHFTEQAIEANYNDVVEMTRYDILQELRSRKGFTAETYQIENLQDLLTEQRFNDRYEGGV